MEKISSSTYSAKSFKEYLFREYPSDPVKRREILAKEWIYSDRQMRKLTADYPDAKSFTAEYLAVLAKTSKLSSYKRSLVMTFFSMLVKQSAVDIITAREKEEVCAES